VDEYWYFLLKFVKWVDVGWSWLKLVNLDLPTKRIGPKHPEKMRQLGCQLIQPQRISTLYILCEEKRYIVGVKFYVKLALVSRVVHTSQNNFYPESHWQ